MNAYRNYSNNTSALAKNLERLSSGYKINRAGDDAAGLAISEKMRAQITGLDAAQKNVKDGISLVNTAEGAMQEIQDMLNRMVSLATQSANGTYDNEVDRKNLQAEVDQLKEEINRIADSANFNGIKLLDGSLEENGGSRVTKGSDRIIQNVLAAGEDPIEMTGVKTILDGGDNSSKATEFVVDFTGLAKGEATEDPEDPAPVPGAAVAAQYSIDLSGKVQADVDAKAIDGETITWNTDLDTTMGDFVTAYNAAGKDYTAAWDAATSKLTLTANTAGAVGGATAGVPANAPTTDITGATVTEDVAGADATTRAAAPKAATPAVAAEYSFDLSGKVQADVDSKAIDGETITWNTDLDTTMGDFVTAYNAANKDYTAAWDTGTSTLKLTANTAGAVGGATAGVPAAAPTTDITGVTATEDVAGADEVADGGDPDAESSTIDFKIGGKTLAEDVEIAAGSSAADIAAKIFTKLAGDDEDAEEAEIELNGAKWTVTVNEGKLNFALKDSPNADNIKGNFDWDVIADAGELAGNHTAGTVVTVAGNVGAANAIANTVFQIKGEDIQDGTTITLDGKTVTLAVGADSKYKNAEGTVVDLTGMESSKVDLDAALAKISEAFKDGTDNFIVGVNDTSNDDKHAGLTVHKKETSQQNYDTIDKLAGVFSMATAGDGKPLTLQIGDTSDSYNQLAVSVGDMHVDSMVDENGISIDDINIGTQAGATSAINTIKAAINYVSSVRGTLGAISNRLDHTANNLSVMAENITDAESTIRDTDIAEEMMAYTKNNILVQSAQAMLAQANQVPQGVLQLLQ